MSLPWCPQVNKFLCGEDIFRFQSKYNVKDMGSGGSSILLGGGTNPPREHQHTVLPIISKNYIKFGPQGEHIPCILLRFSNDEVNLNSMDSVLTFSHVCKETLSDPKGVGGRMPPSWSNIFSFHSIFGQNLAK